MYALNGKSAISNIMSHYTINLQRNEKRIKEKTDLERTVKIIKKSKADIIGISEVLDGQEEELKKRLAEIGYGHIYFAKCHRTRIRKLHANVAVASKIRCEQVDVKNFPNKNKMGSGGGIIECYIPEIDTSIINVHLANFRKKVKKKQIGFLQEYLDRKKNKIILLGDFNIRYKKLKGKLEGLELASGQVRTCSTTPVLRRFVNKDLDHVFVKGFKANFIGELNGFSDHKLIYVDLK
jgi:endonuclease/exonuclease/phosphatase family metal-dependent hydrolase